MQTTISTKDITALLERLIKFPTVTHDKATNRAALDWVEQQLSTLPLYISRYEHNSFASLIATTRRTKSPHLWLLGHIDVVPGAPATFQPRVEDGRIYGRGSHDMKFAIAIFIALGLMLTSDEEVGGEDGVKWLLEKGYRGSVVINPDTSKNWDIEVGSKGLMWWELNATGAPAHASRTWEGINAIDLLTRFVDNVRSHLKPEPCGDSDHWHSTVNYGTISGGTTPNQVPEKAMAVLDIRITPDTTLDDIRVWMKEAEGAVPGVTATPQLAYDPYSVRNRSPIKHFQRVAKEAGVNMSESIAFGSSDSRHFAHYGIPTITPTPVGSRFHVADEWIDIESLSTFYEIVRQYIHETAQA
jgi:succinyl-diaminopimelate desuccinylase